jgi:8-oxo-dGTP diphosphatase
VQLRLGTPELRSAAKALVTSRGRVLLTKEQRRDGSVFWSLPGGGMEADETFVECLRREIAEELRCRARIGESFDTCLYRHTTCPAMTVYTVFDVTLEAEPDPNPAEGIVGYAWRRPTDLPPKLLTPLRRVVSEAVPRD